ncbi:uncharacterized protein L201_002449 [Kwoniella dendrophila CBS 6074]|uniref:Mmc1 C-terminal domain-containing protein n=1 Tax=Kwoniella dendrophila CBS 6074 TaxID=1295534 RepID=A0AAX4JRP4_9TREE
MLNKLYSFSSTISKRVAAMTALNVSKRYASAATAIQPPEPIPIPIAAEEISIKPVQGAETILPVLKDIENLLQNEIGGDDIWSRRVKGIIRDLSVERRGRIAVIGDDLAAPKDVVSALLQDPLVDNEESRKALLTRHEGANIDVFQIGHGLRPQREPEALSLAASWLQLTGYDVVEINAKQPEDTISHLLNTDSLMVVIDPIRLLDTPQLSSVLPLALSRGSVHIVINGHLPPRTSQATIEAKLRDQLNQIKVEPVDETTFNSSSVPIFFVKAEKALNALDALAIGLQNQGPSTSNFKTKAFDIFQKEFLESHVGPLQQSLTASLGLISEPQLNTSRQNAGLALNHIENIIFNDRDIVKNAEHTVGELRRLSQKGTTKAKHLSISSRGIEGGLVEGSIEYDLEKNKNELEFLFKGKLSWLGGLIGKTRIDDIQFDLNNYLLNNFGKNLENQIIFESGQLSYLQKNLDLKSNKIIKELSILPISSSKSSSSSSNSQISHPFTSPLLLNHLSTLSLSIPQLTSKPIPLLEPIIIRRNQLLNQSIPNLQSSAQKTLLLTYSTSLLGLSLSWLSYVPPIEIFGSTTAIGLGLLSIVSSIALGQKLWKKAQKKFWRDWFRITAMMKGDLQTRFDTALVTQILAKPIAAADGLEKLIQRRERRLDELQDRVNALSKRI